VPLPRSLRALGSPNFRIYYTGQAVSMIGSWVQSLALMWLAYSLSGSTWFTGLVGFLNSAPYLVLSPFAGVLEGGWRRILIAGHAHGLRLAHAAFGRAHHPGASRALALVAGVATFETPPAGSREIRPPETSPTPSRSIRSHERRALGPSPGGSRRGGGDGCFA
jgi:hypothetical protein